MTSASYKLSLLEKQFVFIHWSLETKINFIRANLISCFHKTKKKIPVNARITSSWTNHRGRTRNTINSVFRVFILGRQNNDISKDFSLRNEERPPLDSTDKRMNSGDLLFMYVSIINYFIFLPTNRFVRDNTRQSLISLMSDWSITSL